MLAQNLNLNCHLIFYTTSLTSRRFSENDSLSNVTITSSSSEDSPLNKYTMHTGKWLPEENKRFLEGVAKYGGNWKKIQSNIRTRTTTQARSHAQKIILKIKHGKMLTIPSWVNTIQELFCFIKQFPQKKYIALFDAVLTIANEDLKRLNKKQKLKQKVKKTKRKVKSSLSPIYEDINNHNNNNNNNNEIQIEECSECISMKNVVDSVGGDSNGNVIESGNKEVMLLHNKKGKELFYIKKNNSSEDVTELSKNDNHNESKVYDINNSNIFDESESYDLHNSYINNNVDYDESIFFS